MSMGRVRVLAMDLQPLFTGPEYTAKYAQYWERLAAVRAKYPRLGQELQKEYYKGSPFFSDTMLYARWGAEDEASGFMESVVMPAFQGQRSAVYRIGSRCRHLQGSLLYECALVVRIRRRLGVIDAHSVCSSQRRESGLR